MGATDIVRLLIDYGADPRAVGHVRLPVTSTFGSEMPQDMLYEHADSLKRNAGEIRTKVVERSALGLAIPGTDVY
jgi:hypothetical protein